jgi:hypothetical protein
LIEATVARAVKALDGAIKAYEKPPEKSGGCTMNRLNNYRVPIKYFGL